MAARVLVTGAAGQIAYSLVFMVARGEMLGPDRSVILHLLDLPQCKDTLEAVVMELQDCALPLVQGVVATSDLNEAVKDVDYAILCGAFPRRQGMERKDLLERNANIFKEQGAAFDKLASRDVKIVVVGNPANTNALILSANAPSLPKSNFTALTRLDLNRAKAQVAAKLGVSVGDVHNVFIWGNHSSTQFPDPMHGVVSRDGKKQQLSDVLDKEWAQNEFLKTVQQRGAAVINMRKSSSAASAAQAIVDHMRDWIRGTPEGEIVSMGVPSDGSYGIQEGVIYSFPVTTSNGTYKIVDGLPISEFAREKMDATAKELLEEKETAFKFLGLPMSAL